MDAFQIVYPFWRRSPESIKNNFRQTPVYKYILKKYFEKKAELVWAEVSCDDLETDMLVPKSEYPWWSNYEELKCHEPLATRTYLDKIDEGDVFWDMGSKFGYEARIAAELNGSPERVHIFESMSSSCVFLQHVNQINYNNKLNIVNKYVGEKDNWKYVSGDGYYRKHGPPDFVKIDIDGAEVHAVEGMKKTIKENTPTVLVEIHPAHIRRKTGLKDDELVDFMLEHYDQIKICWRYREPDAEWKTFDREEWEEEKKYRQSYQMLFEEQN